MVFQSIGAIKTLAALYTAITTLAAMDQAMLVVNRSGKKTFVANQAPVDEKIKIKHLMKQF